MKRPYSGCNQALNLLWIWFSRQSSLGLFGNFKPYLLLLCRLYFKQLSNFQKSLSFTQLKRNLWPEKNDLLLIGFKEIAISDILNGEQLRWTQYELFTGLQGLATHFGINYLLIIDKVVSYSLNWITLSDVCFSAFAVALSTMYECVSSCNILHASGST